MQIPWSLKLLGIILKYQKRNLSSFEISQACIYPKYPTKTMLFLVYSRNNITTETEFFYELYALQIWLKYHWITTLWMIGYTSKCENNFTSCLAEYK